MAERVGEFVYNKKDLIGHGAFAVVFKGHHRKKEDFVVAIKVIAKKNLSKTQNLLAKEIKILKELHHENVVSLFDCQETSNSVFLVMEYCNGGDLADYLRDKGSLSEDTIHIFLRQIASAMCTLQSKGVVHRDLKPQNLLLHHSGMATPSPSQIKVKIADFGFARFLPGEMMAATLCGSPMYMAPEVIMSKAYNAKADLWSVGTIVYQCLTGKAPFQANSPQQLKKFYEKSKVISPNIPAGTSKNLKDLLIGLLRRNPKDRLDFDEFFSHPFLTGRIPRSASTPVAVPSKQRKHSSSPHGARSPSYSPNFGAEALGDIRDDLLSRMTPPRDLTRMSPQDPPTVMNISSSGNSYSPQHSSPRVCPSNSTQEDELAPEGFVLVPSNPETRFQQQRNPSDPLFPFYSQSPPRTSRNPRTPSPPLSRTPKKATFTVGSPYSITPTSPASLNMRPAAFHSPVSSPSSAESPPIEMPIRRRTSSSPYRASSLPSTSPLPIPRSRTMSEGLGSRQLPARKTPSPTQPGASTRKRQNSSPKLSIGKSPTSGSASLKRCNVETSPLLKKETAQFCAKGSATPLTAAVQAMNEQAQVSNLPAGLNQQACAGFSSTSTNKALAHPAAGTIRRALSNIEHFTNDTSPILTALACQANVGMGVPITDLSEPGAEDKQMIRVHSCPAILAMGLPRKGGPLLSSPAFQLGATSVTPMYRHHSGGGCIPIRGKSPPPSPTALPTIPGSPTKTSHSKESAVDPDKEMKPLRGLFTVGSSSPLDNDTVGMFCSPGRNLQNKKMSTGEKPAVVNQGTKVTWGFEESSSPNSCKQIAVAKEIEALSPDMEGPIALIAPELPEDTLLDTEHTEGVRKLNFVVSLVDAILEVVSARGTPFTVLAESVAIRQNESFLGDQIGLKSDELRKMEQLVLYVKALRALNLSLLFAQGEIRVGHLKPSNAVKNVLNDLNSRYHKCLEKASELKQLVEPGIQILDGKAMTVSADRLMYHYAMEQCQNAALDELFGNPKECKQKYETAQVLLQGLEEDAHTDDDRRLLHKYKSAVDKRLTCISRLRSRKTSQSNTCGVNAWQ